MSMHHSFDVKLAIELKSVELAILVHHFQYWINKNQQLGRNFVDGRTWTYQTHEEIAAHFPYLNREKVKRYVAKLEKLGILRKANYNKKCTDKTTWYAFENEEMFTMCKFAPSTCKNAPSTGKFAPSIPHTIPSSISTDIKDLGQKRNLAVHKFPEKNLDACKRWGLNEEQSESFRFLETCGIDAEDKQLCFWAKEYPLQRLKDVFNEAKHNKARSLKQYMKKLLNEKKVVFNARIEANSSFARDFMRENNWYGPKIYQKYLKIPFGNDFAEISFDIDSAEFLRIILEKYENCEDRCG